MAHTQSFSPKLKFVIIDVAEKFELMWSNRPRSQPFFRLEKCGAVIDDLSVVYSFKHEQQVTEFTAGKVTNFRRISE